MNKVCNSRYRQIRNLNTNLLQKLTMKNLEQVLVFVNQLIRIQKARSLSNLESDILRATWQNDNYKFIAKKNKCSVQHVKKVASNLWKVLSPALEEKIKKANFRSVLEQKAINYQIKVENDNYNSEISFLLQNSKEAPLNNLQNTQTFFGKTNEKIEASSELKDKQLFSNSDFYVIQDVKELIHEKIAIVQNAKEKFLTTGSRSRSSKYLKIIEDKLSSNPDLIHYRVLINHPHHSIFKEHLLKLLSIRKTINRDYNYQTIHIGLFTNHFYESEKFICANEKKVLIVLPSINGIGWYDTALISTNKFFVKNMIRYVQELYSASEPYETIEKIKNLEIIRTPDIPVRGG